LRRGCQVDEAVQASKSSMSGWVLPFLLLGVAVGVVAAVAYSKYRKLMKTHLL
jgi:hypothetical protein